MHQCIKSPAPSLTMWVQYRALMSLRGNHLLHGDLWPHMGEHVPQAQLNHRRENDVEEDCIRCRCFMTCHLAMSYSHQWSQTTIRKISLPECRKVCGGIFFINDSCGSVFLTLGDAIHGQVALCCVRNSKEHPMRRNLGSSTGSASGSAYRLLPCLSSCPDFQWPASCERK